MKQLAILLMVLATISVADGTELQYHDGTPMWLCYQGIYRGTWFDVEDFIPGSCDFLVEYVDVWFYHHTNYPWDTSVAIMELWNGDQQGPYEFLASSQMVVQSMISNRFYYDPPVEVEPDFWCLQNTELSAMGCPSQLLDNSPGGHSFYSSDFLIWDCWCENNLMISATGDPVASLGSTTWGSLKTLF